MKGSVNCWSALKTEIVVIEKVDKIANTLKERENMDARRSRYLAHLKKLLNIHQRAWKRMTSYKFNKR